MRHSSIKMAIPIIYVVAFSQIGFDAEDFTTKNYTLSSPSCLKSGIRH